MNKREQDEKQEARKKTGCSYGEVLFTYKTGSAFSGYETIRLYCDGGEGPFMMLEIETIDREGKVSEKRFIIGEGQLRGLELACSIGRHWCESGWAPGIQ
jgi:hypothetical protein